MGDSRKLWLDWERGLAVLFMVEVHVVDAWLEPGARSGPLYATLNMLGGFAAPGFLFMAGLSQVLADGVQERRGVPPAARRRAALGRALWLLGVAYAFRLGEFLLGAAFLNPDGWKDLLKVDILNVMALSLAATALIGVGRSARTHLAIAGTAALAIVLATPPIAAWALSPGYLALPPAERPIRFAIDHLHGTWPRANFSLFNWAAFALAGSAVGRLALARERPGALLAFGAGLFALGLGADRLPPFYAHQDFWHTSPAWFAMRLGGTLALTGALQALPAGADRGLSWLRTLGRHSLLGYMASVELTFGLLTRRLHGQTSLPGTLAGIATMIGVTWALCAGADRWKAWRRRPTPTSPAR